MAFRLKTCQQGPLRPSTFRGSPNALLPLSVASTSSSLAALNAIAPRMPPAGVEADSSRLHEDPFQDQMSFSGLAEGSTVRLLQESQLHLLPRGKRQALLADQEGGAIRPQLFPFQDQVSSEIGHSPLRIAERVCFAHGEPSPPGSRCRSNERPSVSPARATCRPDTVPRGHRMCRQTTRCALLQSQVPVKPRCGVTMSEVWLL